MEINVDVLEYLIKNGYLNHHQVAEGIGRKIIFDRSIKNLSKKQLGVYSKDILPLLEPKCVGVMGWEDLDNCIGNGVVEDESLLISYLEKDMVCQHCRYERQRIIDE